MPASAHYPAPSPPFNYVPHPHLFPQNPYPPPPPPIAHKVWILNCRACNMFITNRAMKAVLLLRPNVSLYSSDALPLNCSAHTSNPDALRPPAYHKPGSSTVPSRTCECLTQTLCCHGCGGSIGYMIVIPCTRCTSSITATNRATNGHRFVFHSSEVTGIERHYIKNELGVILFDALPVLPPPQNMSYPAQHPFLEDDLAFSRESSPVYRSEYLPTPPLEFANPVFASARQQYSEPASHQHDRISSALHRRSPSPPFPGHSPYQSHRRPSISTSGSPPPLVSSNIYPTDHKDPPIAPPSLKPGDTLFWHHLSKSGEISGVTEDERARHSATARAAGQVYFDR